MNIQGLKPCPFCGGNAIEVSPYDQKPLGSRWIIKCVDCGASIQGSHRAMNKAAWNQRVHEPRTGKWELDPDGMDWNIPAWRCSECGFVANYIGVEANGLGNNPMNWAGSKFCPQCGARITGYVRQEKR